MTTLFVALAVGVAFGALLQRSGLGRPDFILRALRLEDLTLLKFMALALGVAAVGIGILSTFGIANLSIKPFYLLGVVLGGLVFGAGFAIAGYCPGTSLVAGAEGRRDAWFTVAGAFVGALAYVFAYPALAPYLVEPLSFGKATLDGALGVTPLFIGVVLGAMLIVAALRLPRTLGKRARISDPDRADLGAGARQEGALS